MPDVCVWLLRAVHRAARSLLHADVAVVRAWMLTSHGVHSCFMEAARCSQPPLRSVFAGIAHHTMAAHPKVYCEDIQALGSPHSVLCIMIGKRMTACSFTERRCLAFHFMCACVLSAMQPTHLMSRAVYTCVYSVHVRQSVYMAECDGLAIVLTAFGLAIVLTAFAGHLCLAQAWCLLQGVKGPLTFIWCSSSAASCSSFA